MHPLPSQRALRRHHRERLKRKLERYYEMQLSDFLDEMPDPKLISIWSETPKGCSCWMCGNPRKHHQEVTWQEVRDQALVRQELAAYYARESEGNAA